MPEPTPYIPPGPVVEATVDTGTPTVPVSSDVTPTPFTGRLQGEAITDTPVPCGSDASNPCWVYVSQTDPISGTLSPILSQGYGSPAPVEGASLFIGLALVYVVASAALRSAERVLLGATIIISAFAVWLTGDIHGAELGGIVAVFLLCARLWQWLLDEFIPRLRGRS